MGNERSNKFTWDWTPDEWAWSPDAGRWRPEYGSPSTCVAFEVTTSGLTPIEAYDYWRETVFYGFDADRNKSEPRSGFQRSCQWIARPACRVLHLSIRWRLRPEDPKASAGGRERRRHAGVDLCRPAVAP